MNNSNLLSLLNNSSSTSTINNELNKEQISAEQRINELSKNTQEHNTYLNILNKELNGSLPDTEDVKIASTISKSVIQREIITTPEQTLITYDNYYDEKVKLRFKTQGWVPLRSLTLIIPKLFDADSSNAILQTKYANVIQRTYAIFPSLLSKLEVFMGDSNYKLSYPGNKEDDTFFYSRLLLALKPKNREELIESGIYGLPYQNTFSSPNHYLKTGNTMPYMNASTGPDWSTNKEAVVFDNPTQVQTGFIENYYRLPLYYLYPCLDTDILLPPGFNIFISYLNPITSLPIIGINPQFTNQDYVAGFHFVDQNSSNFSFLLKKISCAYESIIFNEYVTNYLFEKSKTRQSWNFMNIDIYSTARLGFTTFNNDLIELYLPIQNKLPKALIICPRTTTNSIYANPYEINFGAPIVPLDNNAGYVEKNEICPFVIRSLIVFPSDDPNNILFSMNRTEDYYSIMRNGFAYNSKIIEEQNNEMCNIHGNKYYFKSQENNIFQTKPYVAILSPNKDLRVRSIQETINTGQITVQLRYNTLQLITSSNYPNDILVRPGTNDYLEIYALRNNSLMAIQGNSIQTEILPYSNI